MMGTPGVIGRRSPGFLPTLATALVVLCAGAASVTASQRVIAVGDVHGASEGLERILRMAGLVDDAGHWSGSDSILVQMGDMLDRGRDVRGVMDLLIRLQDEAPRAGGRVEVLMGNHEAMNLLGIRRDVNVEAYGTFADSESTARLEEAWDRYARFQVRRERLAGRPVPDFGDADREAWLDALPLGWLEYVEAMSASGHYGQWLRQRPAAIEIGDVLFVHGGVAPEIQGLRPDALNRRLAEELEAWDDVFGFMVEKGLVLPWSSVQEAAAVASTSIKARSGEQSSADARSLSRYTPRLSKLRGLNDWFLLSPDGPLWFRGPAVWDEAGDSQTVFEILDGLGVRRMVIAHSTVADGRIETRFDDRVVLVDTGILGPPYYPRGRLSALEIVGGGLTAIYPDGRRVLVPSSASGETPTSSSRLVPRLEMVAGPPVESGHPEVDPIVDPSWRGYVWRDIAGNPLPMQDEPHLLQFLRTAAVESSQEIERGAGRPLKLVLAKDGVRAHAIFRSLDVRVQDARGLRSTVRFGLRDRADHELAAYRIDRLLGLRWVPPVVQRRVAHRDGTLQLWVESAITEKDHRDRKLQAPDRVAWLRQLAMMHVFDGLIGNFDRNQGNMLIDGEWNLWLIDHTRSFLRSDRPLAPEKIQRCDRRLLRSLRELDGEVVRRRLTPLLGRREIDSLLARRDAIVARIEALTIERGEDAVLFDLEGPALDADRALDELERILVETGPVVLPPGLE